MKKITRFRDPVNLSAQLRAANERLVAIRQQRLAHCGKSQGTYFAELGDAQDAEAHVASAKVVLNSVATSSHNQRPRQQIELEILPDAPSAEPTQRTTIRVQPSLLAAMLREEMAAIGRIWLLVRHLDEQGRGCLDVAKLRAALTDKSSSLRVCGWRRLRQLLQEGKGVMWERDDFGRIWLYGTTRVAANLNLTHFQGNTVELPIAALLQSIGKVRASFYTCFHAGREAMPISRDRLQTITGIAPRTQRDYDRQCAVERVTNIAILDQQDNERVHWEHGRAAFPIKHGRRRTRWARRLPNSYCAPYQATATNSTKPLNRQLRRDLAKYGTQGNMSHSERQERLYFTDGQHAAKHAHKQEHLYLREREKRRTVIWNGWHNQPQKGDITACNFILQHA